MNVANRNYISLRDIERDIYLYLRGKEMIVGVFPCQIIATQILKSPVFTESEIYQ
jgi:hypothetical protein